MNIESVAPRALRLTMIAGIAAVLAGCAGSKPPQQQTGVQNFSAPQVAQPAPVAPQQVAVRGTAFPVDGMRGKVPAGSRLVVRIYDAAGGDVNVRAAEGAFKAEGGLPLRYEVPVAVKAIGSMDMPAVAARLEGPGGRVIYRNETAVLLVSGKPGDIPMKRQGRTAASAVTLEWTAPE